MQKSRTEQDYVTKGINLVSLQEFNQREDKSNTNLQKIKKKNLYETSAISFVQMAKKEEEHSERFPSLFFEKVSPKPPDDDDSFDINENINEVSVKDKDKEKNIFISLPHEDKNKNLKKIRKSSIKSDLMRSVILGEESGLTKTFYFFINIFVPHFLAFILTIIKIIIQEKIKMFCWFQPVCQCNDDFLLKLYSSFSDCLTCWFLYLIINFKSVFIFKAFQNKKCLYIFSFILTSFGILVYSVFIPEKEYETLAIFTIGLIVPLILLIFLFYYFKCSLKLWLSKIGRAFGLNFFVSLNYLIVRFLFIYCKDYLNANLNEFWSKNIMQLLNALYFNLFFWIMKKSLFSYYLLAREETGNNNSGISLMRYALGFCFSINISTLLKMDYNDIGGWICILLYIHFVIKSYSNFDIFQKIFIIIKSFLGGEIREEKEEPEKVYFEKLYAGCMLDFQLIAISRIFFWFFGKRWIGISFVLNYVEDCVLTISDSFIVTIFGLISVLAINCILLFLILWYMVRHKKIILEYKGRKHIFYNVYYIFLLHSFLEGCIQAYSFTL